MTSSDDLDATVVIGSKQGFSASDGWPGSVAAVGHQDLDPFGRARPPSRRRPRRSGVVSYRVRIDLNGTNSPLWRRLEVASDLFLDEVHDLVQMAFGWTDSHLHRFGCGPEYYSADTEYYLCPFEVQDGEDGVAEDEVRLDEVLVEVGDTLFYNYDFGDDWQHVIELEAVLAREDAAPRAICTGGQRPGPAEDCGGIWGYELIVAATDPTHTDHATAVAEYARMFGVEADPTAYSPTPFSIDEVNKAVADLGFDRARSVGKLPEPLVELVNAVRTTEGKRLLRRLIGDAWQVPVEIDAETATRMVHPYVWLLNRVGTDGITLTSAGYLPPVHVEAAVHELGLDTEWIGKGNRENQTLPVLHLRESAQKAGLVRKHRGRLLLTTRGRGLRTDPVALWWHLAENTPPRSTDVCETQAGLLALVTVAANVDDRDAIVADLVGAIGWISSDGTPLTELMVSRAAWHTTALLRRVGGFAYHDRLAYRSARVTSDGIAFARAALTGWPGHDRKATLR
jgi:hypothetical protein